MLWGFIAFFAFIIIAWLIASFFYPWNGPFIDDDASRFNGSGAFVFRKRHSFAGKRTECKTGEVYDTTLAMCAPIFHAPTAFDTAIMNLSMPVCTSFFNNVCGIWNAEHRNEDRTFSYAYHRNQRLLKTIIESAPADNPISQFYASCKSVESPTQLREQQIELIHAIDVIIGDLNTYGDLPAVFGRLARYGYTAPFAFSIERHPTEPRMVPFITWDGFRNITLAMAQSIFKSVNHISGIMETVLENKAQRAYNVAKAMQDHNTERVEDITDYMEYVATDFSTDLTTFAKLPAWSTRPNTASHAMWNVYFQSLDGSGLRFAPSQSVWLIDAPYLEWLLHDALYHFDLRDWRAYFEMSIIYNCHQFNPALPDNVYFRKWDVQGPLGPDARIYHRIPRGSLRAPRGSDQCTELTEHLIPGLVAEAYLRTMPEKEAIRTEIKDMTRRILDVLVEMIDETSWLSQPARDILKDKIRDIDVRVAEPDMWEVEPFAERLSADRFAHNMNHVRRYRVHRNLQLWHKDAPDALDRNAVAFFSGPLSDVNAYYSGPTNSITILAGILQAPFFSTTYSNVSKHAILGSVIGHELAHALDYHGLYWDRVGSLKLQTILPEEAFRAFVLRSKCVVKEFSLDADDCPGATIDYGNVTMNEDMADLTGIRLSYRSFFSKTAEGRAASIGDKQHFWMIFGQAWCSVYSPEVECAKLGGDPHAWAEYRVDRTLRNIPEFPEAYPCVVGNPMYHARSGACMIYGDLSVKR